MQVNFLDSEKYFKYLNNLKTLLVNIFVKYIVISRLFLHRIEHNVTLLQALGKYYWNAWQRCREEMELEEKKSF